MRKARAARTGLGLDEASLAISRAHLDFLKAQDAQIAPAGDGHGFDEGRFSSGTGLELRDEAVEEFLEAILGLAFEDDGLREHAMTGAIAGRDVLTFGRNRAAETGAIDAGGFALTFSAHTEALWKAASPAGDFRRQCVDNR